MLLGPGLECLPAGQLRPGSDQGEKWSAAVQIGARVAVVGQVPVEVDHREVRLHDCGQASTSSARSAIWMTCQFGVAPPAAWIAVRIAPSATTSASSNVCARAVTSIST